MTIVHTTTVLNVADHDLGVAWYSDLFGREPDRRPMEPSAEWQLTDTGAVMVCADDLSEREIVLEPYTLPSGQFRLDELTNPSGNTVTFTQDLK